MKAWIYRGMYGEEVLETDVRPGGGAASRSTVIEICSFEIVRSDEI